MMPPNMPPDDFEASLSRQPLKRAPAAWRAEILSAAKAAAPAPAPVRRESISLGNLLLRQFSALLWPHPKAWAALAALWLVIAGLNLSSREHPSPIAAATARPSPAALTELRQQRRFYAELVGLADSRDAAAPNILSPKPRSERDGEFPV